MKKITLVFGLLFAAASLNAQTQQVTNSLPKIRLDDFSEGYTAPLGIENAGPFDNRLFIVEKGGKIWICDSAGKKSNKPFLNITSRVGSVGSEQGLLGLAFHPQYYANGYFYVNYTNVDGDTRVSRFSVSANPNRADTSSELVLLKVRQPFVNHNAGQLKFRNGYLFIALGDGGDAADPYNNGQDPNKLLGKMLRIDVNNPTHGRNYGIPPTNPYIGVSGWRPEIWASGFRNPFRFSFDHLTSDMWIGDVGQDSWEEIDYEEATSTGGQNYGWGCFEGSHFFKANCNPNGQPPVFPIAEYAHSTEPCSGSITGGYVYRGMEFPKMYGKYFYADYCTGILRTVYKDHDVWVNRYLVTAEPQQYSSFGENNVGELFLADVAEGEIYHIVDSSAISPRFASGGQSNFASNLNADKVSLFPNPNSGLFTVQLNASQKETYTVNISNQLGQQVLSETKTVQQGFNEFTFSSDKFTKGMYIMQIQTSDGIINKRFSVQ
ncbi:MAG: PQQ-dependent sugar dehydrogenase [Bacteroidia bacterium]